MPQFNDLTVKSIRQLTAGSVEISFNVPDELSESYVYEHGQFVVLRAMINDELVERAYSICRAPYERQLNVAVKCVEQGIFSSYATSKLKEGDVLSVSKPNGAFTCSLDSSKAKQYLFIAAGSGITPVIPILKTVLASEPQSQCVLFFGNKTTGDVMFLDELVALKNRYSEQLQIEWLLSQEAPTTQLSTADVLLKTGTIHHGRINQAVVEKCLTKERVSSLSNVFLCGPEEMALDFREYFLNQRLLPENVKIELFSSVNPLSDADEESVSNVQVKLLIDGEEIEVVYEDPTESILEHALRIDPDLPYGCQNGSCGACQAKLMSGKVSMINNYALSDSEVEEGYVLLCQARPKSKNVAISYDE